MKNILLLFILLCLGNGLNAQCLYTTQCTTTEQLCDYTENNPFLWHETYWWDNDNQTADLSDATCVLSASAADTCSGAVVSVKYRLFLDLDGNDTVETVIKSWEPPAPGTVNFNNINNPNYNGGEVRVFDQRPVSSNELYQFAIQIQQNGNTTTAAAHWNTSADPGNFVVMQLPHGKHRIEWVFEDNLSNQATCTDNFETKDCKKPVLVCVNGLSVNIMPTGQVNLWATDFLQYTEDNSTPSLLLELGIRRNLDGGTGFPVDGNGDPVIQANFNCNELGLQTVQVWAKDAAGNADYCETYVIVQDNIGNCPGNGTNDSPVVICYNGLSIPLQASGKATVQASSLLQAVYDDITPANLIDLGIRRSGTGTGFPVDGNGDPIQSVQFDMNEIGVNSLEIWARDEDGHADYCETYVIITENQGNSGEAPTLICINGLTISLLPTGFVQLWSTDFIQYVEDDNTPSGQIELAIRKFSTGGTGFPQDNNGNPLTSVIFSCSEQGTQPVEVWARDQDGNTSYCETYVLVQDNNGICGGSVTVDQTLCVRRWCDNALVTGVEVSLLGNINVPAFANFSPVDTNGCYHLDSTLVSVPIGTNYVISPFKDDNPANGVTPLDLVKISRHILGLEPLSTYAMIAADANKSSSITSFDIVESRKLIQGIYSELPNNTSWRFVDGSFVFPNPNNPFQSVIPELVSLNSNNIDSTLFLDFIAIKIGDVDCDAIPGLAAPADNRAQQFLSMPDVHLESGEVREVPVSFSEAGAWLAMQAGLTYNPDQLVVEAILPGSLPGMEESSFAEPAPGMLNLVWFTAQPHAVVADDQLFSLRLRAKQPLQLSQALQLATPSPEKPHALRATGYNAAETAVDLQLLFRGDIKGADKTVVYQAQPNPTTGATNIPMHLAHAETVNLLVTDVSGKVIWRQQVSLEAGTQNLNVPAMPQPGVYLWQVQAGEGNFTGKIVKI